MVLIVAIVTGMFSGNDCIFSSVDDKGLELWWFGDWGREDMIGFNLQTSDINLLQTKILKNKKRDQLNIYLLFMTPYVVLSGDFRMRMLYLQLI